jgi:ABC-type Fe3+-citrate transport system substrate-binding protein
MTIEQKINDIIKKSQEVESQLEEIKKNISEISNKVSHIENTSGGESYLTDYSRKRIIEYNLKSSKL